MQDARTLREDLDRERNALHRLTGLGRAHWIALLLSLTVTLIAWQSAVALSGQKAELRFEHESALIVGLVTSRLLRHEQKRLLDTTGSGSRSEDGIVTSLMRGVLERSSRLIGVALFEDDRKLYDDHDKVDRHVARHRRRVTLDLPGIGRTLQLELWSNRRFEARTRRYLPHVVLLGGLIIDALLLALFVVQSSAGRRTLTLANSVSELSTELTNVNTDLERFAFVASHDLKAPLSNVVHLLRFAAEDLERADPRIARELRHNFDSATAQLAGMQTLIDQILRYSTAIPQDDDAAPVDTGQLVREVGHMLGVADGRLGVATDLPVLRTQAVRLEQVFANLIGNAFKYHHDPENAHVSISAEPGAGFVRFAIADDGPGMAIDAQERIFELFHRLPSGGDATGSGIGLSIVRRAVDSVGGTITVHSAPGEGCRFDIDWPVESTAEPAQAA